MNDIWGKLFAVASFTIILIASFVIGADWQKWRTTDRLETFDGASRACEHVIQHNEYLKTHPEGNLLGNCIKYVMNQEGK